MDGADIKRWRALHRLKQSALADMLGVTQATVSKWESGLWQPTKTMALRLNEVISGVHEGKLAIELACIAPQLQVRSIVRGKNFQFMGASAGMKQLWPETCAMVGQSLRDHFVNEAATYCEQGGIPARSSGRRMPYGHRGQPPDAEHSRIRRARSSTAVACNRPAYRR